MEINSEIKTEIAEAIQDAGGIGIVATACTNRTGRNITAQAVSHWRTRGMPASEWTGATQYARIVCDLIEALGNAPRDPLDLCPNAGQYMVDAHQEAA